MKKLSIILSVLLLAILACSTGGNATTPGESISIPTEPTDQSILFRDDFSNTSGDWGKAWDSTGGNGGYRIVVNKIQFGSWGVTGNNFEGDVVVEVDAVKKGGAADAFFGVVCRDEKVDGQEHLYFMIFDGNGTASINKFADNSMLSLGNAQTDPIPAVNDGGTVHIRAECISNTLTLYVNDKQLVTATDDSFTAGDAGLIAGTVDTPGTDVLFDNFLVRRPSSESSSTPAPTFSTYNPVPRWMLLGQPGYGVEILGEKWNYTKDHWEETFACIDYTREKEPYVFFEQCFSLIQPDITFESQRDAFLNNDFEILTPSSTFGEVGKISLLAKRIEDNSAKYIKFFEIIGTEKYMLLVEMNVATDDQALLQTIYENQVSNTIDYVLQNSLEKSRLIPRPTATPLSPSQNDIYDSLAANLITEPEASVLYGSTWEALGDIVSSERMQVCRDFEDRTNADVLWVRFGNCIFSVKESSFDKIVDDYKQSGDMLLESRNKYDDQFVVYGYQDGHTYYYAFLLHEEFVYFVILESRTLSGQSVEDVFTEDVDNFLFDVLMVNVQ